MTTLLDMLARNALAAALLAGLVLAATLVIKRPAVRNALWVIVLVRLLVPPVWSVPLFGTAAPALVEAPVEIVSTNANETLPAIPEGVSRSQEPAAIASAAIIESDAPLAPRPLAAPVSHATAPSIQATSLAGSDVTPAAAPATPSPEFQLPSWLLPLLFVVWTAGALAVVVLAGGRIRRFQRELRHAVRAPEYAQLQAAGLVARLGMRQCPVVWLVPGRVPPLLWMPGLSAARAMLVFPADLFFKLEVEQRGALIAHELAHLRRRDPWVRWLELASVALYWWHPLLGLVRRRLRESEEQCCDAWVVTQLTERKAYATALMETVDFLDGPACPAAPALASGASPVHDLQRRLTMIMLGSMRGRLSRLGALAILGVAVGALAFGPAFISAQPEEPKEFKGKPFGKKGFDRNKGNPDDPAPKKDGFGPANDELEKARQEFEKARDEAEKAVQRVRDLHERLQKLASEKKDDFNPKGPPMRDPNRPDGKNPMRDPKGPDGPQPPLPPFGRVGPFGGPDRQLQDMQKQIDEMKQMIEDLRKQLRGPNGPFPKDGKEAPMGERKNFRPFGGPGGPGGGFPGGGFPGRKGDGDKEKLPPPREKDN